MTSPTLAAHIASIEAYERHEDAERLSEDLRAAFGSVQAFSELAELVRCLYPMCQGLSMPLRPIAEGLWSLQERWQDPEERAKTLIFLAALGSPDFPWYFPHKAKELELLLRGAPRCPLQSLILENRSALWSLFDTPNENLKAAAWLLHSASVVQEPEELELMLEAWRASQSETLQASLFLGVFRAGQFLVHQRGRACMTRCNENLRTRLDPTRTLASTFCALALGHLSGHLPDQVSPVLVEALTNPRSLPLLWCTHERWWSGENTRRVACALLGKIQVGHPSGILQALNAVNDAERSQALVAVERQLRGR